MEKAFVSEVDAKAAASAWKTNASVLSLLQKKFDDGLVKFDWNGHHQDRVTSPKLPDNPIHKVQWDFGVEEQIANELRLRVLTLMNSSKLFKDVLTRSGKNKLLLNNVAPLMICYSCGKRMKFSFDGKTIRVLEKCSYPKGHPPYSGVINIPSGTMVFANFFDAIEGISSSELYRKGIEGIPADRARFEHQIKLRAVQLFCGNSCPAVHRVSEDELLVGISGDDPNAQELPGKYINSICTDLWAWSMTDLEHLRSIDTDKFYEKDKHRFSVNVPVGKYEVTQFFHLISGDVSKTEIYSKIKKCK